jgi:hypothetical protein
MWAVGLGLFVVFCGYCALRVWRHAGGECGGGGGSSGGNAAGLGQAALGRAAGHRFDLLLATTNKLCQEVAVIPFLWVLPLSLYLLTFIISFDHGALV